MTGPFVIAMLVGAAIRVFSDPTNPESWFPSLVPVALAVIWAMILVRAFMAVLAKMARFLSCRLPLGET
jgi:hypothetical protein